METQQTPKSWYVCGTGNGQRLIIDETTGANIAVVYDEADAPLLAAAPDLLGALVRARDHLIMDIDADGNGIHSNDTPEALAQARTAIAKATETP